MLDQGIARKSVRQGATRVLMPHGRLRQPQVPPLRIGLLNNMPDPAFRQTELQFRRLIGANVTLMLFSVEGTPRGAAIQTEIATRYQSHKALPAAGLDALVITGSEPIKPRLDDEAFFQPLGEVMDWAAENTVSTLLSCLASHATVLHRDGIERRPLASKCSGVFACSRAVEGHPLLEGLPETVPVPHSRWNALDEADLVASGYTVLRRSPAIGVDLFVKKSRSMLVFLQGHPEYDADSLAREYRRDVTRYLDGSRETYPTMPEGCFTPAGVALFKAFEQRALAQRDPALHAGFPALGSVLPGQPVWQGGAAMLFRNWIRYIAANRAAGRTALSR